MMTPNPVSMHILHYVSFQTALPPKVRVTWPRSSRRKPGLARTVTQPDQMSEVGMTPGGLAVRPLSCRQERPRRLSRLQPANRSDPASYRAIDCDLAQLGASRYRQTTLMAHQPRTVPEPPEHNPRRYACEPQWLGSRPRKTGACRHGGRSGVVAQSPETPESIHAIHYTFQ